MATPIAGFPFFHLEFTKDGEVFRSAEADAVLQSARRGEIKDLVVLAHGWNNDMADASRLYERLLRAMRDLIDLGREPDLANRKLAVLGVFWPSKKFTDEELIPGGGASLGDEEARLMARLEELKGTFDLPDEAALEEAKTVVGDLEHDPEARRRFVDLLRSVLPAPTDPDDDASDAFFRTDGDELLRLLQAPVLPFGPGGPGGGGGAAAIGLGEAAAPTFGGTGGVAGGGDMGGGAAGLADLASGFKAGARRLLNYVTYYQMKERAGKVGARGLNPFLRELHAAAPGARIHLVGHSFGGRLVTAAAMGEAGSPSFAPASMTLLQAAFSHNGFAKDFRDGRDGFFREVVTAGKVTGPILITHTRNDQAVGKSYPIASRIARQDASDLGDADDVYGGIGRNGALARFTPEAVAGELLPMDSRYTLQPGKLHNLLADRFIHDHGDVTGREVAHAVLSAVAAG